MMWKTTFREIRQSLGRYLAILAIVALGVGFFAGLKVTKPSMVETTQAYLDENNFYDFRLISTLGFEEEDVAYLAERYGVDSVQGAVNFDILYLDADGAERVIKAHSITEGVNGIVLTAGRLPESPDECVVDADLYGASHIGETIRLSEGNDEEDLEHFAYEEYTIVGIVWSSLYIQFERGNTSLGNGTVSGFMYLLPEGFDTDYYMEIYVKFTKDFPLYSAEYDAYMEEKEAEWDVYTELTVDRRFDVILEEARQELADARAEFEQEKADAEAELTDAWQQLLDAEQEIADGWVQISDAQAEMVAGRRTILEKEAELRAAEQELFEAELTLAENEVLLIEKERELEEGIRQWNAGKAVVDQNRVALDAAERQIQDQLGEYRIYLENLGTSIETAIGNLNQMTTEELESVLEGFMGTVSGGDAGSLPWGSPWEGSESMSPRQLAEQIQTYIDGYQQLQNGRAQLAEADRQLSASWSLIEDGRRQIEEGKQQLADYRSQIADGWAQAEDGRRQLADARRELISGEQEIADAEADLNQGEMEYNEGLYDYEFWLAEFNEQISDAERELAEAQEKIDDIAAPEYYVLGRDTNVGYVCFESDSNIVENIANVFPVFFFLVAALVCMTTMNRMVEEQRTQIGTLKALGYSDMRIMSKYLFYSGSAALIGGIAGFAFGTVLFPRVIWAAYGLMYSLPGMTYVFDWKLGVLAIAASLICSMGVTWTSCRRELAEVAAQLMRPKTPKAGKRVFLEYIPFIWKHLSFLRKVSVRNVLRYKKRFFMMVTGISGCTALLLAGFGIKDSIGEVVTMQYEEIQIDDMSVGFRKEPEGETLAAFEEVLEGGTEICSMTMENAMDLQYEGHLKSVNVVVAQTPEEVEHFLDLHTTEGEHIDYPGDGEAVITHKIAEDFGIGIGDTIELVNEDQHVIRARVSGINQNFVYNYVYLAPETYEAQLRRAPEYKTAHIVLAEGVDVEAAHQLSAELMRLEDVASVSVNQDTKERFSSMMASLDSIVLVVILCAAALAFIVLYNLTNINITERVREIATIKVLGFYKRETAKYVFRENIILTAAGAIVGLFLGRWLHAFIMAQINIDMIAFDVRIVNVSYIYAVILTFAFAWLVNRMMTGKLEKISMTESLKSVD